MSLQTSAGLLDPLFADEGVRALFTDSARLQAMLDFEAALARAQAGVSVIPSQAAAVIQAHCHAELFDVAELGAATALAGNPAIPLAKALTARVAAQDADAARYVHWGATSQDVIDTGLVLQLRAALAAIASGVDRLGHALACMAHAHRGTPAVGRTLLQHALPVTFGLKVAGWLDAVTRHRARLADVRGRALTLQFGGACGTLAALGEKGMAVATALARELGLAEPDLPWHAHRDRFAEIATTLGLLTGTLGKIGRDIALSMQTEVGELFEPAAEGKGGSSAMPHKCNPVDSVVAQAAALRVPGLVATMLVAMVQEHERGVGGWHAEWETLPQIVLLVAGALRHTVIMAEGLEVDTARMRETVDATHGLIMAESVTVALAEHVGRQQAHQIVERACRRAVAEGRHLRAVLGEDPAVIHRLQPSALDRLLDPVNYLGSAAAFIDRALAAAPAHATKE
jgi:3-carboxy-cis,cis-muconate cycloisomerase